VNILVVTAHHDDLELGCGGTVAKLVQAGHRVVSLVLTHSGYSNPAGEVVRSREQALEEAHQAAKCLGYSLRAFHEETMDLAVSDVNVCKIVDAMSEYRVDTLFTHWPGDTHPIHQRVATMALQAARRTVRVFAFAVNWYLGPTPFHPTTFVAIDETQWQKKIDALACYRSEFGRAGSAWVEYLDHQTRIYGAQLGVGRAEGFMTIKNLMEIAHVQ
jgi:LmbE family N-acetylglucosaminyl deacetylase